MSEKQPLKKGDEAKQNAKDPKNANAKEGEEGEEPEEEEETFGDKCSKGIIFVVKVYWNFFLV